MPNTNSEDMETKKKIFGEIEEIEDEVERRFNRFKNFSLIRHPPHDHHYYTDHHYYRFYRPKKTLSESSFSKRIEQEWSVLDKNIPDSIFVQGYDQRIDLMRAAIIGPPGGPYHHCVFFFDILFPKDYPTSPPQLHYHSYGLYLSPNLRPDARVSLPILKAWNPGKYNILHVLLGIQNLILGTKPLEKYRMRVFELTCQKMIRVLRKPMMGFEDFVAGHFRRRAHPVLMKFKENEYDSENMIDLFVSLFKMFEKIGAYCGHHLDFLRPRALQIGDADLEARIRNTS